MLKNVTARRLVAVASGLALVAAVVSVQTAPALSASGHSQHANTFIRALPAHPTALRPSPTAQSSPAAMHWHQVKNSGAPGHQLVRGGHIYLRHATHLVTASPKTLRSHPYMTTPAAIAREKLLAAGKAPPTTVPSVTAGDVKGWLAHTRKVGRNDIATGTNFDGADYTGWIPPDGGLAAGPHEVITAINETVNTFTKSGTLLTSQTLDSLFTGFPQSGPFDPHVVYDPNSHRFWLVAAATDGKTNSYFYVAVSNDSDTQDGWSVWYMPANDNSAFSSDWCDYPEIGLSSGGYVYITCNFFGLSSPGDSPVKFDSGPSALIRIIPESDFTGGGCCSWWEWWNNSFAIQPTVTVNSATTNGEYLAASSAGGGSSVTEWQIYNESKCCSAAPSMYTGSASTGQYNPPPCATQPSAVQCLDSGDARFLGAFWQYPYLYAWSHIACGSYSCPFLVVINNGSGKLTEGFYMSHGNYFSMYPAVGVRPDGTMSIVFDVVNSATDAGSWAQTIPDPSVCTVCTSGNPVWVDTGSGTYDRLDKNKKNRWGDYSGAWPDPDGTGIWVMGEYAKSDGTWGMWDTLTQESGDRTPPNSSASLSPAPNGNGWNNTNTTVHVTSTDGGSGVYFQTLTGTGAQPFGPTNYGGSSAAPTISSEGATTVAYNATDNWRNTNATQWITVSIDKTYPNLTGVKYKVLSPGKVRISATAVDLGCGHAGSCVQTLYYYYNDAVDGTNSGAWHLLGSSAGDTGTHAWNTTGLASGKHLVAVDPIDYAGNLSQCSTTGSNTCPSSFAVHDLTVKLTHNAGGPYGSVKLSGGLTPNPCNLTSCSYSGLPHGSHVKFTASANKHHKFKSWRVNGVKKTAKSITVTIHQDTTIQAIYS